MVMFFSEKSCIMEEIVSMMKPERSEHHPGQSAALRDPVNLVSQSRAPTLVRHTRRQSPSQIRYDSFIKAEQLIT